MPTYLDGSLYQLVILCGTRNCLFVTKNKRFSKDKARQITFITAIGLFNTQLSLEIF